MAIRVASHRIGGRLLEKLLNADGGRYQGSYIPCGQGHRARFVEFRNKDLLTVLAPVEVHRAYYHCEECGAGVIPKDRELDIVYTSFSPGVRRMMGQWEEKRLLIMGGKIWKCLPACRLKPKPWSAYPRPSANRSSNKISRNKNKSSRARSSVWETRRRFPICMWLSMAVECRSCGGKSKDD